VAELRALLPVVFHPGFLVAPGVAGCELVLMFWRGTGSWSILVSRHHRSVAAFVWSPSGPLAQRRRKLGQLRLAGEERAAQGEHVPEAEEHQHEGAVTAW